MKALQTHKVKQTNTFKKSVLLLAITTAISMPAMAVDKTVAEKDLDIITVTASRTAMNIDDSLASQIVINRADIDEVQPKSVLDLLSTVAGIDFSTSGGRGQASSVYMRGANSSHTLILLNGVRISSATLGSTNINDLAPELIERIEIVKGPRAALWGSDAIGGVIQIFTRKLNDGEHFVRASLGSEGYKMLNAGVGIEHGDGHTSINIDHEESNGFDAKDDAETDDDGYSFDSISINGQQKITDTLSVDWLTQVDQGDTEYDSSFGGNESAISNYVWKIGANYQWDLGDIKNDTQFNIGQNRVSDIRHGNGTSKDDGSSFDSRRKQYSVINSSLLSEEWLLNLGADFYSETLKGDAEFPVDERDTTGVFAHVMYSKDKLSYELATRYDDVEGVKSEVTYNSSIGYQVLDNTQVSLSVGTGFKAPTFNDLYYPLQFGFVGNTDLVSESSKSYELSIKSSFDNLSTTFNLYKTDIDNLIEWTGKDADNNTTPVNISAAEIKGAELGVIYKGLGGQHQFNVSYIKAEDASTGEQLGRRAKQQANYKFSKQMENTNIYADVQYKGKRYDYPFSGDAVVLDSYSLVNLGIKYAISESVKVTAKINNAFNVQYQNSMTYFTQDRVVYFGVTYQNF
ncbi:TonB-dependent receptor domain-containing protein [Colwellia sp. RE-S-Sl-9]